MNRPAVRLALIPALYLTCDVTIALMNAQSEAAPRATLPGTFGASIGYLKASNPDEDDRLGTVDALTGLTLAISGDGNTLAASAPYEDSAATGVNGNQHDNSAGDAGAVYMFTRADSRWQQQGYIKASNTGQFDKFGFTIALSRDGNTLAVAAPFEDGGARGVNANDADESAENAGAVYVFVRRGAAWSQQAYIKASNADAGDQFGWSLALSADGGTLAVGASAEGSAATGINGNQADNSAELAGAVYIFSRAGTSWSQQAYVKGANTGRADLFGFAIALSADGNTLAVGAYDEDGGARGINGANDDTAGGSGAAYVFVRRGSTWSQEAYIKASNTDTQDRTGDAFGSSVALSGDGNTLGVGVVDEDNVTPGICGSEDALAGRCDTSTPTPQIGDGSAGALFIFTRSSGTWAQQAFIRSSNIRGTDQFALRLAFSDDGNVLAAGAPLQNGGGRGLNPNQSDFSGPESGAVYLFTRASGRWSQDAYLKAPNAEAYDQFGSGVGLSGDGRTLAVTAGGEDGGASGAGGRQDDNSVRDSGAAYVY